MTQEYRAHINDFLQVLHQAASGDFSVRATPPTNNPEANQLGQAINTLLDEVCSVMAAMVVLSKTVSSSSEILGKLGATVGDTTFKAKSDVKGAVDGVQQISQNVEEVSNAITAMETRTNDIVDITSTASNKFSRAATQSKTTTTMIDALGKKSALRLAIS